MTSSDLSVPAADAEEIDQPTGARFLGRRALVYALRFGTLTLFLALWETASRTGLVDKLFASSPSLIVAKFAEMIGDGSIWPHVAATASVTAAGFGLAVVVGVPIGVLMGRSALINATPSPSYAALYASPAGRLPAAPHHLARHRLQRSKSRSSSSARCSSWSSTPRPASAQSTAA